jgi:streptomycin 3"-adenylyltransferase
MAINIVEILNKIVTNYDKLLEDNLLGIYLHGSLTMGCFNEDLSDIDYIVVVKEKIPFEIKRRIINFLIELSQYAPGKGIEMSIVLERDVRVFVYPTPFELHYSKDHDERYINDKNYICGDSIDKDLAAHVMVINHRGVCLHGKQINKVFEEVAERYYIDSIIYDIENAQGKILNNPVYFVLNLCRVLYYLRERIVSSKYEGGEWGKEILPGKYFDLIEQAINIYLGKKENIEWNESELEDFAEYMLGEIRMYI